MDNGTPVNSTTIASGEVRLAVRTYGHAASPTVVLVHGFPDTQAVWEPVAARLARDGLRVVTYDVRGAGASTAPGTRSGYRVERLVDDLVAILDRTLPDGEQVHLAGHDWGSVQLWSAVLGEEQDARLRGRIASFSSISGPALQHFGYFLRSRWHRREWRPLLEQLRRSWYIGAFQVPAVPEQVFSRFGERIKHSLTRSQRLPADAHWGESFADDAARGVNLYRANAVHGVRSVRTPRTRVPTQVLVPRHDPFLTPALYDDLPSYASDLTRTDIDAGHWAPRTHPDLVAADIGRFVRAH